jgi:hypothetical protein
MQQQTKLSNGIGPSSKDIYYIICITIIMKKNHRRLFVAFAPKQKKRSAGVFIVSCFQYFSGMDGLGTLDEDEMNHIVLV